MCVSDNMICNYATDIAIYACDYRNEEVIRILQNAIAISSKWFRNNSMKVNQEKCHLLFFSNLRNTNITIKIDNGLIHESSEENVGIILEKA